MKRILFLLALLLIGTPTASVGFARPAPAAITVVDDRGATLTLTTTPHRLISLAPNVTEMLYALGLGPEVVGVSSYTNYPPAATKLPVVIDYTRVNLEKIVALKPDLIVAAAIVPITTISKLRALHLAVLVTDPHDIGGILKDIGVVGSAAGVPQVAAALDGRLQQRIDKVAATVKRATARPRVYYELEKDFYTVGRGSYMDTLITMAGGANIAGGVANPYPKLSAEKIIAADPQYIVLGDAAFGTSPASVGARPGWAGLSAVKLHQVFAFNDDLASRPGPRIVDGLEKLARLIHPELYR